MKKHFAVVVASLVFALGAARAHAQSNFKVDSAHSFIVFKISHLGVSSAWGRFNDPQGTVVWDDNDPSKGRIEVTVQTAKVDTGNSKRDQHLKSPDFFNAAQFPTLTFKSKSITKKGEGEFEVAGDLTVHGVTKPITVTVKKIGEGDKGGQFGYRAGWETTFTVKRSDFGMNFMPGGIGDEVTINVGIEGVKG
jgi:polyisoprenoid-binding protein YceI